MIANIGSLIEIIENDEKLIAYMKQVYKEKTGDDIVIPDIKTLVERQLKKEEDSENKPNFKFQTFKDKVIALNLPDINDREARSRLEKLRRKKDTKVFIKKLDISYFAGKEMTIELLYKVLDGLNVLRSVEEINLSHNNLGDEFIDVISDYLMLKGLTKINLSFNNLTKASVKKLVATLKGCHRLESIDVSYNPFNTDEFSCSHICAALKECDKIQHFGINDASRESAIRFIHTHPTLVSVNLEDSRYKKRAWDSLSRVLGNNRRYQVQKLSLKFCKIDFLYATPPLVSSLRRNNTLIYLNLYNTALDDIAGTQIINALCFHKLLEELNLGANFLGVHFCKAFGKVLGNNNILRKVIITKNYLISREFYYFILEGLINNQSIISFGDLIDMKIGVKYRECTEKILALNKCFGDWRSIENIKSQKANLFMTNVGMEQLKKGVEIGLNMKKEDIKTTNSMNNSMNTSFLNSQNNLFVSDNIIRIPVNVSTNKLNSTEKIIEQKFIELPKENSNFVDSLKNKLPEGTINPYFQESLKIQTNTSSPNKLNTSNDKIVGASGFNTQGKFAVKYSIPGSKILQELEKYDEEANSGKRKKKPNQAKSASKFNRKGKNKIQPTIINSIANIAQELINTDDELQGMINENKMKSSAEKEDYKNEFDNLTYGRFNFEDLKNISIEDDNIISKYNLIENNYDTEFHEQPQFYI